MFVPVTQINIFCVEMYHLEFNVHAVCIVQMYEIGCGKRVRLNAIVTQRKYYALCDTKF